MGEYKLDNSDNLATMPGGEILFARLASNLLESDEIEEAIKLCEKGLKKFPTYATAHYILARCYMKQKKTDEARAEYERVLRYDPNHVKAIRDLAGIHFANGFQDLYKGYLKKLYTLNPLNEDVISEVKNLGEYEQWQAVTGQSTPQTDTQPYDNNDVESREEKEELFLEHESESQSVSPVETPEKIDLSQFDNLEDDFTTILHGKLDYPVKPVFSDDAKKGDLPGINDTSGGLDNGQPSSEGNGSTEDTIETMDELIDENDEIIVIDHEKSVGQHKSAEHFALKTEVAFTADKKSSSSEQKEDLPEPMSEVDDLSSEEDVKFEQPKIITQTLGEILVSQKKYAEAKSVFEALKKKEPGNKSLDVKLAFLDKIIGLEKKSKF